MKLKMAENSLFAILLRSPWWISLALAGVMAVLSAALLPPAYRLVGVLGTLPFVVVGAVAARRQWGRPSAARVEQTAQALGGMPWPRFASLVEQAFRRDGYAVQRGPGAGVVDFELERAGRRTLVSARRWKSARIGLETLRALQAAREAAQAAEGAGFAEALCICLGELTDTARPYAAEHGIAVWQAAELAQALRGLPLAASGPAAPPQKG